MGHGVADLGIADLLYRGGEPAHLAGDKTIGDYQVGSEHPHAIHLEALARAGDEDLITLFHGSVEHPQERYHPLIAVVHGVEDERPERSREIATGGGEVLHNRLKDGLHILPGLGRDGDGVIARNAHHPFEFCNRPGQICVG